MYSKYFERCGKIIINDTWAVFERKPAITNLKFPGKSRMTIKVSTRQDILNVK